MSLWCQSPLLGSWPGEGGTPAGKLQQQIGTGHLQGGAVQLDGRADMGLHELLCAGLVEVISQAVHDCHNIDSSGVGLDHHDGALHGCEGLQQQPASHSQSSSIATGGSATTDSSPRQNMFCGSHMPLTPLQQCRCDTPCLLSNWMRQTSEWGVMGCPSLFWYSSTTEQVMQC